MGEALEFLSKIELFDDQPRVSSTRAAAEVLTAHIRDPLSLADRQTYSVCQYVTEADVVSRLVSFD
jgi:hypothetical protein